MTVTSAENLIERFDAGEDVSDYFDFDKAVVEEPNPNEPKNIGITVPMWLVRVLDDEAERRAVSRKAVINDWLVDRADEERRRAVTA